MTTELTQQRVRELFEYDPLSGVLTRRQGANAGRPMTCRNHDGYLLVRINRKNYRVHRVIWLYMTGQWPSEILDHINGDRADNRWTNLREATVVTNQQNQRHARADNQSGLLGVAIGGGSKRNPYTAFIRYAGRQHYLGCFPTPEAAHAAYLSAKREHHVGNTI